MNEVNLKVNMSYGDGSIDDVNNEETNLILFILWGIFLPLIAGMGLVGNVLTMVVLWRKEMQSTTILYLRALVVTDTGILIGAVITLTPISCANYLHGEALDYFKDNIYPLIHTPGYYIIMTLQQCNVWITVSVSMERYIAICHPFRAARLITKHTTYIVMIVIIIASCIYNTPHLFATKAVPCGQQSPSSAATTTTNSAAATQLPNTNSTDNSTDVGDSFTASLNPSATTISSLMSSLPSLSSAPSSSSSSSSSLSSLSLSSSSSSSSSTSFPAKTCYAVMSTEFGLSPIYTRYRTVFYSAIIYVVPFLALVILNSFLIKELMMMQQRRSGTNINDENEANLSLVLVLIVVVFIFCQTPGLVSQFDVIPIHVFYIWLAASNLMFTTNSAVNFLIYTAFGRKFRKVLLRVFRHLYRRKSWPKGQQHLATTTQVSNFHNGYEMSTLATTNTNGQAKEAAMLGKKHKKDTLRSNGRLIETVPLTDGRTSGYPDVVNDSVGTSNGHTKRTSD